MTGKSCKLTDSIFIAESKYESTQGQQSYSVIRYLPAREVASYRIDLIR